MAGQIDFFRRISQMDVMKKYDKLKLTKPSTFVLVPKTVFIDGITTQAIGMYAYLAMKSARCMQFGDQLVWQNASYAFIANDLQIAANNYAATKELKRLIQELEDAGYIKTNHFKWIDKKWFNVILTPTNKADGFAKVYPNVFNQLLKKSKGLNTLKRLALYVAMRSCIFDNTESSKVVGATPSYLGSLTGYSASTVFRHFVWLREHNIVAYYHVRLNNGSRTTKYYYADINDHKILTKAIKDKIKHKRVLKVLD